jgi:hypothetical protein
MRPKPVDRVFVMETNSRALVALEAVAEFQAAKVSAANHDADGVLLV